MADGAQLWKNVYQRVTRETAVWGPEIAYHYGVTIQIHVLSSLMS